MGKGVYITLTAAAILGAAVSAGQHSPVPPHEERVAYFVSEHKGSAFSMHYEGDFDWASAGVLPQDRFQVSVGSGTGHNKIAIRILDGVSAEPADGILDRVSAQYPEGNFVRTCTADSKDLPPPLLEVFIEHYATSSDAFYRHVKQGLGSFESNIGEEEFDEFFTLCEKLK